MTEATPTVPPEKLTRVYIKMRERRSQLKAAFTKEDDQLKAKQAQVASALLEFCKTNDIKSSKTGAGTFTRTVKTRYWTGDWEEMNKFIIENNLPEFYTKSLNQTSVKNYLEENPDSIPKGLNVDTEYVISVRKPTTTKGA